MRDFKLYIGNSNGFKEPEIPSDETNWLVTWDSQDFIKEVKDKWQSIKFYSFNDDHDSFHAAKMLLKEYNDCCIDEYFKFEVRGFGEYEEEIKSMIMSWNRNVRKKKHIFY